MSTHQWQSDQLSQEYLQNISESFSEYWKLFQDIKPEQKDMLSNLKDFIKLIIWLSAWIVWFAVPIFGNSDIIQCICLFKISLWWFIGAMILWIIYLYKLIIDDRKYIQEMIKFWSDIFANEIEHHKSTSVEKKEDQILVKNLWITHSFLENMGKDLPALKAWNYLRHATCIIFVLSLILLFISII